MDELEEELELETLEAETLMVEAEVVIVELSPDHFASRQRAHGIKVEKFLAGGEF